MAVQARNCRSLVKGLVVWELSNPVGNRVPEPSQTQTNPLTNNAIIVKPMQMCRTSV